ncbi:MAG: SDR family NAD(P)-dependent oxidoreductase [Proteobacteria bacterium]|jgi:3-oxoacyl-[acyl-carrier protein] reductase|nr:SDR family NAD(P)-dependent oxidoreductase [Pseudomonadota bacterium]
MNQQRVMLITGTRKGIGKYLVDYYIEKGYTIYGCSREPADYSYPNYHHYCLDVADEPKVRQLFADLLKNEGRLDVLINNAGIASMNHALLTPVTTVQKILSTNVVGSFLFSREAAKVMMKRKSGRIVNFATVATPMKLAGEAIYASSKAAIVTLTQILAREFSDYNVTVNAVGPTPVLTDLIRSVPQEKMDVLLRQQAIHRFGEFPDISNVIDFFIKPESDFVTGQIIYLGGA